MLHREFAALAARYLQPLQPAKSCLCTAACRPLLPVMACLHSMAADSCTSLLPFNNCTRSCATVLRPCMYVHVHADPHTWTCTHTRLHADNAAAATLLQHAPCYMNTSKFSSTASCSTQLILRPLGLPHPAPRSPNLLLSIHSHFGFHRPAPQNTPTPLMQKSSPTTRQKMQSTAASARAALQNMMRNPPRLDLASPPRVQPATNTEPKQGQTVHAA